MKTSKALWAATIAAGIFSISAAGAKADTYNAIAAFTDSYANNPNAATSGQFQFGYYTAPGNSLNLYNQKVVLAGSTGDMHMWNSTVVNDSFDPSVFYNTSGSTNTVGSLTLPGNALAFHPGVSTDSVIRFVAPTDGAYQLKAGATQGDSGVTDVQVYDSDTNTTTDVGVSSSSPTITQTFTLKSGEYIDFLVNNDGGFNNETTVIVPNLTVTSGTLGDNNIFKPAPVPVPAAAGLGFSMLGAFGAFAALRKRISSKPRID